MPRLQLAPHHIPPIHNVRTIYIQHLTDLLHVCLSRGDYTRATRAWAILIRCREVDWKSRWYWGLLLLDPPADIDPANATETSTALTSTQASLQATQLSATQGTQVPPWTSAQAQPRLQSHTHTQSDGRDAERWLKALRVSSPEAQRPAILHALVLHMIKHDRHRAALDELETYLSSYPYLTSAPLHVYAGLLCFYLAQPDSSRRLASDPPGVTATRTDRAMSSPHGFAGDSPLTPEPPNMSRLRTAKGWFIKALELDRTEAVSLEFLQLIRDLDTDGVLGDDSAAPWARRDALSDSEDDQAMLDGTYPHRLPGEDDGLSTDSEADSVARGNGETSFMSMSEMDADADAGPARRAAGVRARKQGRVDPRLAFRMSAGSGDEDVDRARQNGGTRQKAGERAQRTRGRHSRRGDAHTEDDGLSTESEEDFFPANDGLSSD